MIMCVDCIHNKECPAGWSRGNAACITISKSIEDILNEYRELKQWVLDNYNVNHTGYTAERSRGNFDDCFDDGYDCGFSLAVYDVGEMLGIGLDKPIEGGNI